VVFYNDDCVFVDKHEENSDKTLRKMISFLLSADYTAFKTALSIIFAKKAIISSFLLRKAAKKPLAQKDNGFFNTYFINSIAHSLKSLFLTNTFSDY